MKSGGSKSGKFSILDFPGLARVTRKIYKSGICRAKSGKAGKREKRKKKEGRERKEKEKKRRRLDLANRNCSQVALGLYCSQFWFFKCFSSPGKPEKKRKGR